MKLLILGNGFDLALGMKISYADFGVWMEHNHDTLASYFYEMGLVNTIKNSNSSLWTNFEEALGCIVPNEIADYAILSDGALNKIDEMLLEFVASSENEFKENFQYSRLLEEYKGLILSFNYTSTPKRLGYNKEIIYIHGSIDNYNIIIGHINNQDFSDPDNYHFDNLLTIADEDLGNMFRVDELAQICEEVNGNHLKDHDTNYRIIRDRLIVKDVDEIIVCGNSYNDIDYNYFSFIHRDFPKARWILTYFNLDKENYNRVTEYAKKLQILNSVKFVDYSNINELVSYFE